MSDLSWLGRLCHEEKDHRLAAPFVLDVAGVDHLVACNGHLAVAVEAQRAAAGCVPWARLEQDPADALRCLLCLTGAAVVISVRLPQLKEWAGEALHRRIDACPDCCGTGLCECSCGDRHNCRSCAATGDVWVYSEWRSGRVAAVDARAARVEVGLNRNFLAQAIEHLWGDEVEVHLRTQPRSSQSVLIVPRGCGWRALVMASLVEDDSPVLLDGPLLPAG